MPTLNRRALIKTMLAAGSLIAAPRSGFAAAQADATFEHGVASGDPDATSVELFDERIVKSGASLAFEPA